LNEFEGTDVYGFGNEGTYCNKNFIVTL